VITNVYNTTIINKSTTITNVTYANRNVQGAVMVVPQRAFAGAQPVAHAAVAVNAQQIASASVNARVAVTPTRESMLGAKASTAGHVTAPPAAVMNRQVIAKRTPPPPPVPFAKQQQALAAHPGQPVGRQELQSLRPAGTAAARPMVKQAPPGKPATPTTGPSWQPAEYCPPRTAHSAARQPASESPAQSAGSQPASGHSGRTESFTRGGAEPPACAAAKQSAGDKSSRAEPSNSATGDEQPSARSAVAD